MRKTIEAGLMILISILIFTMLYDKLGLDQEKEYKTKVVYPLGVDRNEYNEIWYDDEDYN